MEDLFYKFFLLHEWIQIIILISITFVPYSYISKYLTKRDPNNSRKEKILNVFGGIVFWIFIYLVVLLVKYGDAYRLLETLK